MKVIIDVSNMLNAVYQMKWKEFNELGNLEELPSECKHTLLSAIYHAVNVFGVSQSDVIIATDNSSWRKDVFQFYKFKRAKSKEKSEIDFDLMYGFFNEFIDDLKTQFPFGVTGVKKCEADDIIAVLSRHFSDKYKEDVVILSRDKDFLQLITSRIKLFDPFSFEQTTEGKIKDRKMQVTNMREAKEYLMLHVLIGDTTDGIMNVLSPDHILAYPKMVKNKKKKMVQERQQSLGWKKLEELYDDGKLDPEKYKDFIKQNKKNFKRNRVLIDMSRIPQEYKDLIIENYKEVISEKKEFDFNETLTYFHENQLFELKQRLSDGELFQISNNKTNQLF